MIASPVANVNTLRYGGVMDEKLNRQRWLTAGLETLASEGPEGLRIMPIAERLGVTKGSFYWHFKSLEDYQRALLEEWERCYTQDAIVCLEQEKTDDATKLRAWITGGAYADFSLDRAIRTWALSNPAVREVRMRVDHERMAFLAKLLRGVGWPSDDAQTLGQWTYCAWVGYGMFDGGMTSEKQIKTILAILMPGKSASGK